MDSLINVVVLMTVLSVAAERITNVMKLRQESLRLPKGTEAEERARVYSITWRSMAVGVFVALLMKADIFAILSQASVVSSKGLGSDLDQAAKQLRHSRRNTSAPHLSLRRRVTAKSTLGLGKAPQSRYGTDLPNIDLQKDERPEQHAPAYIRRAVRTIR